eukprot:CAMPEP_0177628674 /NCGR_PEP_ID=MMETSP0447-20121125/257_1 /TAXON_ID=0 /ORGANISM="Stygamoeba regulata, Strain BSH-02190019" /LENGTH=318 /DNA_ID=CAMNT_0019129937 /DNA_START=75 /DNA_END=1031 /DNA_ORIENTATION=+
METAGASFSTGHADMIHDCQLDYYGKLLATCSSDRYIKIFEVNDGAPPTHVADIAGHDGPVFEVSWAHPKFGKVLASCSYDRSVIIWKEDGAGTWTKVHVSKLHDLSVNSISWAPYEYGLMLAAASSDGHVSIIAHNESRGWTEQKFEAHNIGVNAVSWGPAVAPASLVNSSMPVGAPLKCFVTGGSDKLVKVWTFSETDDTWTAETLAGHGDWVRDVAWAPNIGLPSNTIASCCQDGRVIIWSKSDKSSAWAKQELHSFGGPVWRLSWSVTGNILAVCSGDNKVSMWKEGLDDKWSCISTLAQGEGVTAPVDPSAST